jgi:hypothetical protein
VRAAGDHRIVNWMERGVLFLCVLYLGVHTMPRAWKTLNTDFPNYYMSARLMHEGFDTSRMYEWAWLAREKDHRAVDIRLIGLVPITPFSTLAVWPLAGLAPLAAKHVWLVFNLALLAPLVWMLRSMTGLSWLRVALAFALNFPLHRNLLYGQFYILLLLLILGACWAWLRGHSAVAGGLVAVAVLCKIFPVLFFVFFAQRRDWRALFSGVLTGVAGVSASILVFGWNVHRTYLHAILPWTLHGEGLPPYATASASISSVLHYSFLAEPQWNPHPWHNSLLGYAILQPGLQMLALAPAVLLIRRNDTSRGRILLEWSALLTAALAVSTSPASYNFVLMAFPVCVLAARLLERRKYRWLAVLLIVYLGIGFPMPSPARPMGPAILLYVPRLPLMFALLFEIYFLLWCDDQASDSALDSPWEWTQTAWAVALAAVAVAGIYETFHRERAMREEYAYRLPLSAPAFFDASPQPLKSGIGYVAFSQSGYHLVTTDEPGPQIDASPVDELSFTSGFGHVWVERAGAPQSEIADVERSGTAILRDGREPTLSVDGESLAFVRDTRAVGRLMVRRDFRSGTASEGALTPVSLNVYEASFLSEKEYAFSAVDNGRPPGIYLTDGTHANAPLALGEARYPALSPDGRWLAYSRFDRGAWNLWIRDETSGAVRRVADVPCNQMQAAWENDSRTLLYGVDCGRSLWYTAVARRQVIP